MAQEMDVAAREGDTEAYRDANTAWHYKIVSSIGNPRLYDFYENNDRIIRWFAGFTLDPVRLKRSNQEHLAILAACRRRDVAVIVESLYAHQSQALERVLRKLKESSSTD